MLTKKQVKEIKEHLERAQNPVFLFDNDQDGLCSFLLLQRWLGRGKGVPIKSFPGLNADYFRKIHELKADYIFILDKPIVSGEFFSEVEKHNIPVVWIDHHLIEKALVPSFVNYYNPLFNKKKSNEPVTALCYQVTKRKEDMWIAVAGCISDRFLPRYYQDFQKKYPDLSIKTKDSYDVLYKSQIGKVIQILGSGLKDRTTNVINMTRFLIKARDPYDVLEENPKNHSFHKRFNQIKTIYDKLLNKAISLEKPKKRLLFFQYSGDMRISRDISNELCYLFPEKIVVIVYIKGTKASISMRGKNARGIFLEATKNLENAIGGGHDSAIGGQIKTEDVEKFRRNLEMMINS